MRALDPASRHFTKTFSERQPSGSARTVIFLLSCRYALASGNRRCSIAVLIAFSEIAPIWVLCGFASQIEWDNALNSVPGGTLRQAADGMAAVDRTEFVGRFGGIFEHSAWVAERAFDAGIADMGSAASVHGAMADAFRAATDAERLAVLRAHPDLAGKLAIAGKLTEDSRNEQAGAGLDRLSAEEHARFTSLNSAYVEKFGFPFIIAVKGLNKDDILGAFETRINNSAAEEFATACRQVERIAMLRLNSMLPGGQ